MLFGCEGRGCEQTEPTKLWDSLPVNGLATNEIEEGDVAMLSAVATCRVKVFLVPRG